jgi:hypothetical protein
VAAALESVPAAVLLEHGLTGFDESELETVEVLVEAFLKNIVDGGVVQVREHPAGQAFCGIGELGAIRAADPMESGIEVIDAESDGAWERGMQDEEGSDGGGGDFGCMKFLECFESAAGFEYGLPLDGVDGSADLFALGKQDMVLEIDDA